MSDKTKANSAASALFQTQPLLGSGTPVPSAREPFAKQNTDITLVGVRIRRRGRRLRAERLIGNHPEFMLDIRYIMLS